ncbi:MAG TPA: phosphoesterase, partial [Thalassobaculum sp.]
MSTPVFIHLNGAELLADPDGVLVWPARRTLVVADLHLEKGSGFARRGVLLPPYDSAATLARLGDTIARHAPERVIALG